MCCLAWSSGGHAHCCRLSALSCADQQCWKYLIAVLLLGRVHAASPHLEGCDKPSQGTLNHHVEKAQRQRTVTTAQKGESAASLYVL